MTTQPSARVYRWSERPRDTPMDRLERRRIIGEQMMISQVLLHAGCRVPTHAHENEQFACVVRGRVRFGLGADGAPDRRVVDVGPDEVLHLPSNVPHSAEALEESLVLDLFSPPSAQTGIDRPPIDAHVASPRAGTAST